MAEPEVTIVPEEMTDEQLSEALAPPVEEEVPVPVEEKEDETSPNTTEIPEQANEVKEKDTPEEKPPDEVKITKEEYDKLLKRIDEKERFIQKQADEVGKRRKSEQQLRDEVYKLRQRLSDDSLNHAEAMDISEAIRDREAQLKESELNTIIEFNRNTVRSIVPEPELLLDEMIEIVREDGQPDEAIIAFRANPYKESPGTLINLAKRAEQRREMRNKDARIAALEAEISALKNKPKEVVKNIEKALKTPTAMTNDSGQATSVHTTLEESQIPYLSDEALARLIKENST